MPFERKHDRTEGPSKLTQLLGRYREPNVSRSLFELLVTAVPFAALWALMWAALSVGYWLSLLLALPAACFLMRLFMIQHDCGHGACFKRRSSNDWVGRIIGVVTLTPYSFWRRAHAAHHANAGNLDHRGMGDIITLTRNEYRTMSLSGRLAYRLYRNPLVMFGLIPTYLFVLHYRLPFGAMRSGIQPWLSTMGTNVAIAGAAGLMIWLVGLDPSSSCSVRLWWLAARSRCGSSMSSISSRKRFGPTTAIGVFTKPLFTAVRIMSCRRPSLGSRVISVCITCTTYRVGSRSIVFHRCCATTHNSQALVESRFCAASNARRSLSGTRINTD